RARDALADHGEHLAVARSIVPFVVREIAGRHRPRRSRAVAEALGTVTANAQTRVAALARGQRLGRRCNRVLDFGGFSVSTLSGPGRLSRRQPRDKKATAETAEHAEFLTCTKELCELCSLCGCFTAAHRATRRPPCRGT